MKKFKIFILLICLLVPAYFVGCENSNKNTLSTPSIVEIKGGTIIFNPVADAEYYTISINDNEFYLNTKHSSYVNIIDNQINYDASKIFIVGESYTVKIRANAEEKNSSPFSSTYSYKHSGSIQKPTNVKINSTTLTWDAVENASYYLVKIVTPNDKIILDKNGNVLNLNDSESISQADLTEYSFNTNNFDFGSLLTEAGNYQFYVCAVLSDGTSFVESGYTSKVTYTHFINLNIPTNGQIYKDRNELYFVTAIDENANAISISCDGCEKTAEINGSDQSISVISGNLLKVNLTKYFQSFITSGSLNFNEYKTFKFVTQSLYRSNAETSFFIDSSTSKEIIFENTYQLPSPKVNLVANTDGSHTISWQAEDKELVSEYKVVVCLTDSIKEYSVGANSFSLIVEDELTSVAVQAVGKGNYLSSPLSDFASISSQNMNFNCTSSSLTVSWTNVTGAYYTISYDNKYFTTTNTQHTFSLEDFKENSMVINVTALKTGFKHKTATTTISCATQLATPTFSSGQGFNSSKLYELTFTGVENALGYYVHIKGSNSSMFIKNPTLYTTTTIDLSQYICNSGVYTDYKVKVQAVADEYGHYLDSDLSQAVTVSHTKILKTPEFNKVNGVTTPVLKQTVGNSTKYVLQFYGVDDAESYEILINYNKISINSKGNSFKDLYQVDISNYLAAANKYEIKIRAIPNSNASNVEASEFNTSHYTLTKQLSVVTNIQVTENDNVYTLSFDPVVNAEKYRVRIVKENDSSYDIGSNNSFIITQATDVSKYITQQGVYYFYMTALAPKTNSYYADSNESPDFATVSKLTTLSSPSEIGFDNATKDSYLLYWTGDLNADYYTVKLSNPNQITYEFNVYGTSTNINSYMTIQGNYTVSIYSMVNAVGENAKEYSSSASTTENFDYFYKQEKDFLRYSISIYGNSSDFVVNNVTDLKNLLWYHYLYEINVATGLTVMIKPNNDESLKEAIIRFSHEATALNLYNFTGTNSLDILINEPNNLNSSSGDSIWYGMLQGTSTELELLKYLSKKLLSIYPEFNVLYYDEDKDKGVDYFIQSSHDNSNIFIYNYKNELNADKINYTGQYITSLTDYGNTFNYIDLYARKSATGSFKIDNREEVLVTTTEQLLHAVQHNKKPKFIGDSATAEQVYANAKLVLSAIVTNNMTDLQKVTAIFDWLEYGYTLTYYTNMGGTYFLSGSVELDNMAEYGKYKHYYLEGIFEDITMDENGNIIIGSNLATSYSYSKAFALLCAIEGIDATVINGSYSYDGVTHVDHVWNKVYLNTTSDQTKNWYNVDLTFSDNRIIFADLTKGYGISSHAYFLINDTLFKQNILLLDSDEDYYDDLHLISQNYQTTRACTTTYNYYKNSSFGLTYNQIKSTITDFESATHKVGGFNYAKQFYNDNNDSVSHYQKYAKNTGDGELQAFLWNTMIYTEYMAMNNESKKAMFEFNLLTNDNGGSTAFDISILQDNFNYKSQYGLDLNLIPESLSRELYVVKNSSNITIIYVVNYTA